MRIILLTLILVSCTYDSENSEAVTTQFETSNLTDDSLNRSIKSLDRTLKMMDKMAADLDKMNNNLDAIFRAITDCKPSEECQNLKEEYIRQYEENKAE